MIPEAIARVEAAETAALEAQQAVRDARQALVALCPYKIGDTAEANAWEHRGRSFQIDSVNVRKIYNPGTREAGYCWFLYGRVLRENGQPGKLEAERREFFT